MATAAGCVRFFRFFVTRFLAMARYLRFGGLRLRRERDAKKEKTSVMMND